MNKAFEKILEFIDEQIKIEESIAKSKNEGHPITHQYGANCMNVVKKFVQEVASEYNDGWIACGERLPEPIRPVLVTLKNWMNDKCFVRVGRFHTDHWKTDEGIVENSVVIAWQPLPQPYQPKGE